MEPISIGMVVGGRYRVVAQIGDGAMGAVYRVEEVDSREVFALKLLHPDLGRHPEIIARFEREAIAASRIEHPNVVHATDFGCSSDGSFYLVLEFVDGRDLRSELQAGPMEAGRAIDIMRGVVAGIRAAHETGVVHRDLKPENIMLVEKDDTRDFVKLLDFGIARLESAHNPQSGMQALTVAGRPLGTPEYMSPEQVLGKPVDARTDLYSLGVIFFELLAGACPFDGNVPRLLQQHLTAEPPALPPAVAAAHPDLARIVGILLAKEPKNRFQTAAELAEALSSSAAGQRSSAAGQSRKGAATSAEGESRTLASLAMRASLAKKRLVGMVAPPARRHHGSRSLVVVAALSGVAVLLVVVFLATRDRAGPAPSSTAPSAAGRLEPVHPDPGAQPQASSAAESTKLAIPKSRRKPPEAPPPAKGKSK